MEPTQPERGWHLPDIVVQGIARHLVLGNPRRPALLHLMAVCGVCKHWRQVASHVDADTVIRFDALESSGSTMPGDGRLLPMELRFRRASPAAKGELFASAARLLSGYRSVVLAGTGCERALEQLAARPASALAKLTSLSIAACAGVTDALLTGLLRSCPGLQSLRLQGLPGVSGAFLAPLLASCPALAELQLQDLSAMQWHALRALPPRQPVPSQAAWPPLLTPPPPLPHGQPGNAGAPIVLPAALRPDSLQGSLAGLAHGYVAEPAGGAPAAAPQHSCLQLRTLQLVGVNLAPEADVLLTYAPALRALHLDGPAYVLHAASQFCPGLEEVSYWPPSPVALDDGLPALATLGRLRSLELVVRGFMLSPAQMRAVGMLPLGELRLHSDAWRQQPSVTRACASHLDNDGVKALVDSVCQRSSGEAGLASFKLSLCGATALTHDAVSALLRLPVLAELNLGGCTRINAMDKMRLVAKVKAGKEQLVDGWPGQRSSEWRQQLALPRAVRQLAL